MFKATVLTLYPEMFPGHLGLSMAGRALNEGLWALDAVQKDAGVELSRAEGVWFGNCALHVFGQATSRGQVVLSAPMKSGQLEASTPVVNVEAGCASTRRWTASSSAAGPVTSTSARLSRSISSGA